jgi:hypothetical protein
MEKLFSHYIYKYLSVILFVVFNVFNLKCQVNSFQVNLQWNLKDSSQLTFNNSTNIPNSKLPYFVQTYYFNYPVSIQLKNLQFQKYENNYYKDSIFSDTITYKVISGKSREKYFYQIVLLPLKQEVGKNLSLVSSFTINFIPVQQEKMSEKVCKAAHHSVLSSGKWYKLKVIQDGIYKIDYAQLKSWGFSNMNQIQIYGNGGGMLPLSVKEQRKDDLTPIPMYIEKGNDGIFNEGDYILFFAQGPNVWKFNTSTKRFYHQKHQYSDFNFYFITDGISSPSQIQNIDYHINTSNSIEVSSYDDFQFFESEEVNFLRSGSVWYGNVLANQLTRTFSYSFTNLDLTKEVYVAFDLLSVASSPGIFNFSIGNSKFSYTARNNSSNKYAQVNGSFSAAVNSSSININLNYSNSGSIDAMGYVNYIEINAVCKLIYAGTQMLVRNKDTYNVGNAIKYVVDNANSDLMVWDITDPCAPMKVSSSLNGNQLVFYAASDTLRQYAIFSRKGTFFSIIDANAVNNQDIHGSSTPELIIVAPTDSGIYQQALRLANFRKMNDNLDVLLVTTQQVYNEFSSGVRDATAIRDMVKMFFDRDPQKIKYLLLFGKGTFANNIDNAYNYNLIPTYQSSQSLDDLSSYVTDDFFGWMYNDNTSDPSYLLDIGVGRLPVKTKEEAKVVVDKLIRYKDPANDGDWKNSILFVADDQDFNSHLTYSDKLAEYLEDKYSYMRINKVYLDAYVETRTSIGDRYPDANVAVNEQINTGTLIFNYTGHGSELELAGEDIVDAAIIRSWKNINRLPLFITATCSFSRFDDLSLQEMKTITSAGEEVLLSSTGGAIGLYTTTRNVFGNENYDLNMAIYHHLFDKDEQGNFYKLGDVLRLAKNDVVYTGINRLNFTLLGDPSMLLAFPQQNCIHVDSILVNSSYTDTIHALDLVTIKGHYADTSNNQVLFNGTMYTTVFDKKDTITTLANDYDSYKTQFTLWQNTIFRGKVGVKDGKFSFQFIVPKDIHYEYGPGKIVFYSFDGKNSYAGYYNKFYAGGISKNIISDSEGPEIRLYMNDTNFVSGGITDPDPKLLVKIYDKNGINATGIGIGHDIIAILDEDINKLYVLNNFFQSEIDNFKEGSIVYPFTSLSEGKHQIKVTAYDAFNNYSQAYIDFRVVSANGMKIETVYNFPNPFKDYTNFVIEHNWPNKNVSIDIFIYSFSGSIVNQLRYKGDFEGYFTPPIYWNGLDANGNRVGNGMYLYKVRMKDENGNSAENYGKLLIVR